MEEENGARRACKRAFNEVPDSVHATVGRWETELYFLLFTDRETLMSEPGLGHGTGRLRWWERKLHRTLGTLCSHSSIYRWARPYSSYAHHVCVGRGKQAGPRSRWLQPLCSETCLQILSLTCRSPCRKPGWVWTLSCHALQVLGWRPRSLSKRLWNLSQIHRKYHPQEKTASPLLIPSLSESAKVLHISQNSNLKSKATANHFPSSYSEDLAGSLWGCFT